MTPPNIIVAVDPGTTETAVVKWNGSAILSKEKLPNAGIFGYLDKQAGDEQLAVEMVASYGMPVGKEVFETVLWIGRFVQFWTDRNNGPYQLVYRQQVKLHHCQSARAKDGNVRQALIDRFGPPGTKKQPGLTYGVSGDMWSAFAIAVFVYDKQVQSAQQPQFTQLAKSFGGMP